MVRSRVDPVLVEARDLEAQAQEAKRRREYDHACELAVRSCELLLQQDLGLYTVEHQRVLGRAKEIADRYGAKDVAGRAWGVLQIIEVRDLPEYLGDRPSAGPAEAQEDASGSTAEPVDELAVQEAAASAPEASPDASDAPPLEGDIERQIAIREERLTDLALKHGPDSPEVIEELMALFRLYLAQQDFLAAKDRLERAIAACARRYESRPGHPDYQRARLAMGSLLAETGDLGGADSWYQQAIDAGEPGTGEGESAVADAREGQARVARGKRDFGRAQELLLQVWRTRSRNLPAGDPGLAGTREELRSVLDERKRAADDLVARGDLEAAGRVQREVVAGETAVFRDSRDAARANASLAAVLQRQCSMSEAQKLREEVVATLRRTSAPGDPELVEALRELAALLRTTGRAEDARAIEREVLASGARQ